MLSFYHKKEVSVMKTNRWLNGAIPAVGIHISIGAVYAWSVFTNPVMDALDASLSQVSWIFSIAIFFLGMSAAFLGTIVENMGPRKSGLLCGLFYCTGLIGSGFAVSQQSLPLLYLFYGCIGGIGLGIGYITPVKTLVNWFYDRPGLATGLAIMGFGFAAAIAGPVISALISSVGLVQTFYTIGVVYFIVIAVSAFLIRPVPEGYLPEPTGTHKDRRQQFTANQAMKTWKFYALWFLLFINITCGIALLSVASPILQETTGMTALAAAGIVGVMGLFNGGGRLLWATVSDYLGRDVVYTGFFVLEIVAMLILGNVHNIILFQVFLFLVMTCYGGGFSCIPAYLGDVFGTKHLSSIHGRILTAWAIAGIVGPCIISWAKEALSTYQSTLFIFAILYAAALLVSSFLLFKLRSDR